MRQLPATALAVLFGLTAYGCKDVERSEVEVSRQQGHWPTLCITDTPEGRTLEAVIQDLKGQALHYPFQTELSYFEYGIGDRPAPRVSLKATKRPFWDMLGALAVDSKTGFEISSGVGPATWKIRLTPTLEMLPGYEASDRYIVGWAKEMRGPSTSVPSSIGLASVSTNDLAVMVGFHPLEVDVLSPPRITWTSDGRTMTYDCAHLRNDPVNIFPISDSAPKQGDPVSNMMASLFLEILEDVRYIDIPVKAGSHKARVGNLRCEFTCEGLAADERTQITIRFVSDSDLTKEEESLYRRAFKLGTDTWEGASLLEKVSSTVVRYRISNIFGLGSSGQVSGRARWYTHGINEYKVGIAFDSDTSGLNKVRITMGRATVKRVDCPLSP